MQTGWKSPLLFSMFHFFLSQRPLSPSLVSSQLDREIDKSTHLFNKTLFAALTGNYNAAIWLRNQATKLCNAFYFLGAN